MIDRLQQMEDRYIDLGDQMALPEIQNDREAMHKTSKAHRDLEGRKTTGKLLLLPG